MQLSGDLLSIRVINNSALKDTLHKRIVQTADDVSGRINAVEYMGWLGSWLGTNGSCGRSRTGRWRWALRQLFVAQI